MISKTLVAVLVGSALIVTAFAAWLLRWVGEAIDRAVRT